MFQEYSKHAVFQTQAGLPTISKKASLVAVHNTYKVTYTLILKVRHTTKLNSGKRESLLARLNRVSNLSCKLLLLLSLIGSQGRCLNCKYCILHRTVLSIAYKKAAPWNPALTVLYRQHSWGFLLNCPELRLSSELLI